MVDLPDTTVDLPDIMADLPETMNNLSKIIQNSSKFHSKSSKINWDGLYMGDFTQGGEWPYQIGVFFVVRQIVFLHHFIVEIAQNFLYNLINTSGTARNFFPWRSLVELGKNGLWTWLPNIFLKFGVSLVVILTHLEICTGSLDNRFKKPLALSFQNTPWKTDLKVNFMRNFHLKKKLFCILGSVLTLSLSNWIFFVSWQIFFSWLS